jgi:predicted phage-related endonuclease
MPLSQADQDYRRNKVTGSLVNALMAAPTEAALIALWREKVGLDPPLTETWAMKAGAHMERLILDHVASQNAYQIQRRGEIVDHPTVRDVCVKLDGMRVTDGAPVEAKFLAPWRTREEFVPYYYPQVLLQMMCLGVRQGVLVVAQGTSDPVEHEIDFDDGYAAEMMRRVEAFLHCIRTLTPPYPEPPIYPPEKWRTVDIVASPTNWSTELFGHLLDYADTAEAAALHDEAGKAARALIPDDVGKCFAGAWTIARNKKGVLTITTNRRAA